MKQNFKHSPKANKITCTSDPNDIRIFINGILHFILDRSKFVSLQSWYVSNTCLKIEITTTSKDILLEYNSVEKWTKILTLLNEHL